MSDLQAIRLGGDHFDRIPLKRERGVGGLFQPEVTDFLQHGRHFQITRITLSPPLVRSVRGRHAAEGGRQLLLAHNEEGHLRIVEFLNLLFVKKKKLFL